MRHGRRTPESVPHRHSDRAPPGPAIRHHLETLDRLLLDGFVQTRPGDNTPPSRPTSILVGYDASALYIGVRAIDDPRSVRATLAKRDDVLADDHVRIFLDTFPHRRRAYLLAFNPLGIQQDGIWAEGADPDYSFDVLMESRGRVTGSGYEIEVRIPFRWNTFDYDFGGGPKYPRVSPAALADPAAPLDPGPATSSYYQGKLEWKPTDAFRTSLTYTRSRLVRDDTHRTAYDQHLYTLQATRQFGRFGFCRVRADFDSLPSRIHGQLVAGWTPNPGTAIYLGYDDEMTRNGFNPLTGVPEPGLIRSGRTLFLKMSYLLRRPL